MSAKNIFLLTAGILLAAALCAQAIPGHEWPYGHPPAPKLAPSPKTAVGQSAVAAGGDASKPPTTEKRKCAQRSCERG